jgi:hypothetical protein
MDISNNIQLAHEHFNAGNLMEASRICSEILERQPTNVDILLLFGEICSLLDMPDHALQYFKEALQIDPKNAEILCSLGDAFRKKGLPDEALQQYQKAIDINPHHANAHYKAGAAFREKGHEDLAADFFQRAFLFNRSILVTGSHRSGSSWVGHMIAKSPSVYYYHEPLNLTKFRDPCICGARIDYLFQYIPGINESAFYNHFKHIIELPYYLSLKEGNNFEHSPARTLIKDPFALFSAEWLTSKFNMDVIILIRHPAAFVGSLKRLNWDFSFLHFLDQPVLMREHLYPFESLMRDDINGKHDFIQRAALLWKIINHVILGYQEKHKDWIFLRHEDISRRPLDHFQFIFGKLNLPFLEETRRKIEEYSNASNPSEAPTNYAFNKVNSKANIRNWGKRLSSAEIKIIRSIVEDVSCKFYSDDDW